MIDDLSLYDAIFNVVPLEVKGSLSGPIAPSTSSVKAACVLRSILSPSGSALENLTPVHPALVSSAKDDPGATARLYLAAALLPHFGITYRDKKRTYAAVECAVRESLKLGTQNHYLDGIPLLFEAAELFEKNPDLSRSDRKEIGLFHRYLLPDGARSSLCRTVLAGKGPAPSKLRCAVAIVCALLPCPRIEPPLRFHHRSA
jgi:hypothetical protein